MNVKFTSLEKILSKMRLLSEHKTRQILEMMSCIIHLGRQINRFPKWIAETPKERMHFRILMLIQDTDTSIICMNLTMTQLKTSTVRAIICKIAKSQMIISM